MALLAAANLASAQVQINSTPNPVGSGARALGMGGAFIAVADDATAASWNPAGLTQLERPEMSVVYSFDWSGEDLRSALFPELDSGHDVNVSSLNFASFVYPIPRTIAGRNLVLSLSYLKRYDFDRDLDFHFRDKTASLTGGVRGRRNYIEYSQRGQLGTVSPAFGFEITDQLAIGLVWNIWDQDLLPGNEWTVRQTELRALTINGRLIPANLSRRELEQDWKNFEGSNYTIGALYKPNERWSIGLVYHTKFTADVDFTERWVTKSASGPVGYFRRYLVRERRITFPSAIGLGVAYRFPNDKLTLSLDITRRDWDQFELIDKGNVRTPFSQRVSPITNLPVQISPHDPTYTVRLGAEYVFVNATKPKQDYLPSLRGGIFYDPEPASGRKDAPLINSLEFKGDGDPDDYYGATIGLGLLIKNRVNLDLAYEYRWGTNVRKDTLQFPGTDFDVDQHRLYLSTVIYF